LSHEHAMIAMGVVAEESMQAYKEGYDKAWNDYDAKVHKEEAARAWWRPWCDDAMKESQDKR